MWLCMATLCMWLCVVAYACDSMCMSVEFWDEILLRGEECKTLENSIFLRKGKTVISVGKYKIFLDLR